MYNYAKLYTKERNMAKTSQRKSKFSLKALLKFTFFLLLRLVITLGILGFFIFLLWGALYLLLIK